MNTSWYEFTLYFVKSKQFIFVAPKYKLLAFYTKRNTVAFIFHPSRTSLRLNCTLLDLTYTQNLASKSSRHSSNL